MIDIEEHWLSVSISSHSWQYVVLLGWNGKFFSKSNFFREKICFNQSAIAKNAYWSSYAYSSASLADEERPENICFILE